MSTLDKLKALIGVPGVNEAELMNAMINEALSEESKKTAAQAYNPQTEAKAKALAQANYQSAYNKKGQSYTSFIFSEWNDLPPQKPTLEALNEIDEETMPKALTPLGEQIAKLTKPVKQISEPNLDPDPSLEFMRVRQAKEKLLTARRDWTAVQQNETSVLNTTMTRLQAWNIIWQTVTNLPGNYRLDDWLIKRVNQVCDNVIDPSLTALQVDSILHPKPQLMAKPPPPKPPEPLNPFDREFS